MNKHFFIFSTLASSFILSSQTQAFSYGDADTALGKLDLNGFVRAKYESKDWSKNDNRVALDTLKLILKYDALNTFGRVEYSCYQYDKVCDFSSLINAYVGYKINEKDTLSLGLQPLPFGPGRFWENNYYGSIVTQIGLEDIHNIGLKYSKAFDHGLKLDLGYFVTDGGDYVGKSSDSARYPVNLVKPDASSEIQTHLDEKNMFVARVAKDFSTEDDQLALNIGASYWYADVDNKTNTQTGNHQAWSLFTTLQYQGLAVTVVGGENKLKNKDPLHPHVSVAGAFDFYNYMANDTKFYSVDVSYPIEKFKDIGLITPYIMLSGIHKDEAGFKTSTRHLIGASLSKDHWLFTAEYILGKNDLLIGGNEYSLAQGSDDKTHTMLKLATTYNF